nr:glycosyltransferase family 9 protein [Pseudodesulfovibrio sp. JC047]
MIINLTRFGDLIQTQPVISGFKRQGQTVGVVCLENFASVMHLLDGVDRTFPFPGNQVLSGVRDDWRLAARDIAAFKKTIFDMFLPDLTVNLTPSVASRLLAYHLTSEHGQTVGFTVDSFGFNADTSSWAAFLQMAGANRGASPFNISDVFCRTAGVDGQDGSLDLAAPGHDDLAVADQLLQSRPQGTQGFVGLQLGASEDRRRWPVSYFIETAQMLWERDGLLPVLLGSESEQELGDRFVEGATCPRLNCMGRTSLGQLAGVLSRCAVLVTNDTGTMHLAAGLGVPVCAVFLATAQPWDTGPYRAGALCLEPDMACHPCEFETECPHDFVCRKAVPPETMYAAAHQLVSPETAGVIDGARVWRTTFGQDGLMGLDSISGHERTDGAVWISIQRAAFSAFLDGRQQADTHGQGMTLRPEFREKISKILTNAMGVLFLLSQQAHLLQLQPRPGIKSKFMASWQLFQNMLSSSEHLKIIALLWMFETQQHGDDLSSLRGLIDRYTHLLTALRDSLSV